MKEGDYGRYTGRQSCFGHGGQHRDWQSFRTRICPDGAKVIVSDVNASEGEETARSIRDSGGSAIFIKADVSLPAEVEALINKAVATYGRLDCAFNNAGIAGAIGASTHEYPDESWERVIGINLKGVWLYAL